MPYSHYDLETLKACLEKACLAGYIYQHNQNLITLQEALNEDGSSYHNFIQHELSSDQIGLQFGLRLSHHNIEFLIGVTHSNQDRQHEIGIGHLKADQKAFNLCYAFYNYPKAFYLVSMPLAATSSQLEQTIQEQLFSLPALSFLDSAIKINPRGKQVQWMKQFIVQAALNMKVRIQTSLY
jgi:hypothetical protein